MNKRNKIIVSIVGITIVLLALLGITYAYYLTRIQGNTNTNSISITTADLKLVYGDGTGELIADNIMPGDVVATKVFTVKNEGNQDISAYSVALVNIVNDFSFPSDLKISVTCESNINDGECEGFVPYSSMFPENNSELFSLGIRKNEEHTFSLKVNYLYQEFDQSNDMGKTLKGKIQIFDPKDTIEVSGEVTGYDDGDYAEIHSEVQVSQIKNNRYKFVGVPADSHKIYIKNVNDNKVINTEFILKKGNQIAINDEGVTFTDSSKELDLNLDISEEVVDVTVNNVFLEKNNSTGNNNTLAYNIIYNSKNVNTIDNINNGYAIYKDFPITTPGRGLGNVVFTGTSDPTSYSYTTSYVNNYYIYGDSYYFDIDGYFKIKNPKIGLYSSDYSDMIGKYVSSYSGSSSNNLESQLNNFFDKIYKVGENSNSSRLYYGQVNKISQQTEKILTKTYDDYGTSYYFRGGVKNNYVQFANMCFRIVRITGDGSVKIILAKDGLCSSITDSDTKSAFVSQTGSYGYKEIVGLDSKTWTRYDFNDNVTGKVDGTLGLKDVLETWFDEKFVIDNNLNDYGQKLEKVKWDLGGSDNYKYHYDTGELLNDSLLNDYYSESGHYAWYYDTGVRLTLNSSKGYVSLLSNSKNDFYESYVGTISADEVLFAGGFTRNTNYYLIENAQYNWWTLSLSNFLLLFKDFAYYVNYGSGFNQYYGALNLYSVDNDINIRPMLQLKSDVTISGGDGTKDNPYVIN